MLIPSFFFVLLSSIQNLHYIYFFPLFLILLDVNFLFITTQKINKQPLSHTTTWRTKNFWKIHAQFNAACLVSFATETVMQLCHGRRRCTISADTTTFGNPCRPDSRMYLKTVYTCGEFFQFKISVFRVLNFFLVSFSFTSDYCLPFLHAQAHNTIIGFSCIPISYRFLSSYFIPCSC